MTQYDDKVFQIRCGYNTANNVRLLLLSAYKQLIEQAKGLNDPEFMETINLAADARWIAEQINKQL